MPFGLKLLLLALLMPYLAIACCIWIMGVLLILPILGKLFDLLWLELSAASWKRHLSNVRANGTSSRVRIHFSTLDQNCFGDPIYPDIQSHPLRSFPSLIVRTKLASLQGEDEALFFSLRPVTNIQELLGTKSVVAYAEIDSGKIMCIELGTIRLWRSRYNFKHRSSILWDSSSALDSSHLNPVDLINQINDPKNVI